MNKLLFFSKKSTSNLYRYYSRAPINESSIKSSFDPRVVEELKYKYWQDNGLFKPKSNNGGEKFSMVLPPPNVTGSLHIGHSLTTTIQDSLIRYNRMMGKEVLWVPGLDHSGIATQVAVEKQLQVKQGKTRFDLGREKFLEQVFQWTDQYSSNINNQLKITGSSLDWSRSVFTLDEQRNDAVQTAFIRMFEMGLIYRSTRLVNWCPYLQSVISDIEVDHKVIEKPTMLKLKSRKKSVEVGAIHNIAYLMEDPMLAPLIVSTTRPETIFGDTGLAIHPLDERYSQYHGKFAIHPFNNERVPIVLDDILVNREMGTGVVKVTPAHDFNDYQCGQRHNLPIINILNSNGTLNENSSAQFEGVDRLDARSMVVEKLKEMGLYREKLAHPQTLSICSRSGDLLEPILKPQWYVKCKDMADKSIEFVESGEIKIIPESFRADWSRWLTNIQDWCISRQLWWGNPIPAYRVIIINKETGEDLDIGLTETERLKQEKWVVGKNEKEARESVSRMFGINGQSEYRLEKDQDVLDTWFSSGLFPISSMGWPSQTKSNPDFSRFLPLDVMETGSDILFFWVARMVMMCSTLNNGEIPFKTILLHPMIRDSQGRKMSKSLGNVIDPLHVINGISLQDLKDNVLQSNLSDQEKSTAIKGLDKEFPQGIPQCGTDSLRFSLAQYPINGKDINLDISKIIGNRLFCNKLWNASKFVFNYLTNLNNSSIKMYYHQKEGENEEQSPPFNYLESTTLIDKWILLKLSKLVEIVNESYQSNNLSIAAQSLYSFFQYDFCDVYIECIKADLSKPILSNQNQHSSLVLVSVLDCYLRMLHPFMPFITEDLWQRLPKSKQQLDIANSHSDSLSIMISEYPNPSYKYHQLFKSQEIEIEKQVTLFQDTLKLIRSQKVSLGIHDKTKLTIKLHIASGDNQIVISSSFNQLKDSFEKLLNAQLIIITNEDTLQDSTIIDSNSKFTISSELQVSIEFDREINNQLNQKPINPNQSNDKKILKLEATIKQLQDEIDNPDFKQRVPEKVQKSKIDKLNQYKIELKEIYKK
ncbi:hypothetical protein RB653_008792 [Dictyostelium firmibasis]|uniref:valine--tRNA ligase n=1 Tax=Dictyostelium firmibasis TaxID=79012 RepID=A0AAN7U0P3_9MYCE